MSACHLEMKLLLVLIGLSGEQNDPAAPGKIITCPSFGLSLSGGMAVLKNLSLKIKSEVAL